MDTLRSYVRGRWHDAADSTVELVNPSTEEPVVRLASGGVDFGGVLEHARKEGGPALRELGFAGRGELLRAMSKVIREGRDELLELSRINAGTTKGDGSFDIDGGGYSLNYYGKLAGSLGDGNVLPEGEGVQLAKTEAFWGQHVLVPRAGVAIFINAHNFPVWGWAEKAACALLAGVPIIVKPATATAWTAVRSLEMIVESGVLPEGALQFICGSTGDLLDRVGPQDVVAFTGSADTARKLKTRPSITERNTRFNVEADSLNAAVLAPDVRDGPAFDLFIRDVAREMTQKAGQKCTAVRRILVPEDAVDRVEDALVGKLEKVVTGNPEDESVTMGPLASEQELESSLERLGFLSKDARFVLGARERADGVGSPAGKGYFLAPTLLRAEDARKAEAVHEHEAFAPVATLLPYDGTAADAAEIVGLGGGMLVTSAYSNDSGWLDGFLGRAGSYSGRLYVGSDAAAEGAPGSGVAMPQSLHGGPGRAGGGQELGGLAGARLYMQRLALQGARGEMDRLAGTEEG